MTTTEAISETISETMCFSTALLYIVNTSDPTTGRTFILIKSTF